MAELVRRGLEYVLSTSPHWADDAKGWALPAPRALGGTDPFVAALAQNLYSGDERVQEVAAYYFGRASNPQVWGGLWM